MKTILSILFIILVGLSVGSFYPATVNASEASVNNVSSFQYQYYANGTLTNLDIQNVQSFNTGNFYISMVENNNTYFNTFSFYNSTSSGAQLTTKDFQLLNVSTSYLNSSTTIWASQYFSTSKISVFLIYFNAPGAQSLYIFVYDSAVTKLLQTDFLYNMSYYSTNKLFSFTNSNDIFIELRKQDSFLLLDVSSSNYTISNVFQSNTLNPTIYEFGVEDPQFSNDVFYMISNEENYHTQAYNSSVYAFSFNGANIQYTTHGFSTYISSISIANNLLFAYSPFDNIAHVIDLGTNQEVYKIDNSIVDNFTSIRAFNANAFLLRDFRDNLYYCYVQQQGNSYTMRSNSTIFALYNSNPSGFQYFDQNPFGNEYTLALMGDYNYLLAGYTFNNGVKTGFGVVFQSMNNAPSIFVDTAKAFTSTITNSLGTTVYSGITTSTASFSNSPLLPVIVLFVLILVFLIGGFIFYSTKRKEESVEPSKKYKFEDNTPGTKSTLPKTKLCNTCGEKVSESDMFCQNCGNRIL